MKKLCVLGFAVVLCISLFGQTKDVTPDPAAKVILDKVAEKYQSYSAVKANFTLIMDIAEVEQQEEINGKMAVQDQNFRLSFGEQEIISDNTNLWTVMHDVQEVQVDFYDASMLPMQPSDLFTIKTDDFYYVLMNVETVNGQKCDIIELTPNNKDESYFKIKLWVGKDDNTVIKTTVFEKSGNRYTYTIKNFEANPEFTENYFSFNEEEHPDYLVTDLR